MFPKAKWKLFNIHVSIHPSIQIKFVNHCWKIQSTPMEEGGQGLPATDTSAIMPILAIRSEESSDLSEDRASASARAAMAPWVSGVPDSSSTLHSSTCPCRTRGSRARPRPPWPGCTAHTASASYWPSRCPNTYKLSTREHNKYFNYFGNMFFLSIGFSVVECSVLHYGVV